ncbi:MAG: hypothetical protein IJ206_09455 [Oscillospiraceae bacterium]|nr:hypothetical protein [Oscillospiraceae bacterium]
MNGIEKLTERIAADTDRERQSILSTGKAQAAEIRASYEALAESEYAESIAKGKQDAAERIERMGNVAQLEARKLRLSAKQEMLEKAFDLALKKLLDMPEPEYVDLLSKLAVEGSVTGREALILSVADRPRFGKKVVISANEKLEKAGKTAELTLAEESREFTGGLYIQDGKVETNCTFPTIVRMLKEQMSGQVAQILFE